MKELDPKSLEEFDGQEGRPCYVAVRGKIYDISESELWKTGKHMGKHAAGRELGESLENAPHGEEVLGKFQQVGILKRTSDIKTKQPPPLVAMLLKQHPHPITVHFPQALLSLAPLFLILFYFTGNAYFERTCYYLAVTGLLTAVPAILTGFFHWIFKYAASTKGLYVFKMTMSLLLFVYTAAVVYIHTVRGILLPEPIDILMVILYLLLVPLAVVTGHTGGKIVFG
ncbi:MAG: hypothetical protein JXR49_09220 [Acidobacteria bacterium]|nr:hypothetical protein [Acidobacteriota bacterium]